MSVTRKSPASRPIKSEVKPPASAQPAAERRSAEAQLNDLIAKFAPNQTRLAGTVRKALRKRLPTSHEVVYEYRDCFVISFAPNERGYEGVLSIRGSEGGLQLYFNRGKELPDPEKLLQGSGGLVRFIRIEGASTLTQPPVARLMDEAIARSGAPFAPTGRGSIVIRATAAQKRRGVKK